MLRERKVSTAEIAITNGNDEGASITKGLDLIGGSNIITQNDVVVITPNWVNPKKPNPSDAVVVGPESLRALIKYVKNLHPKRLVIATGSGDGQTTNVMKTVGFDKIINEEQVEFIDLNFGPYVDLQLNFELFGTTKINKVLSEMTVLISFTQLKQHEEATMSAAIKNIALGWPPTEIHGAPKKNLGIHDSLHNFIRAMAEQIPIDISIVSANPAMIGSGPTNGVSRHTGLVICGTDPIAVDTIGARLLGFRPQGIHYLFQLENLKLGQTDVKQMNMKGLTIQEAEKIFSEKVYGQQIVLDANN